MEQSYADQQLAMAEEGQEVEMVGELSASQLSAEPEAGVGGEMGGAKMESDDEEGGAVGGGSLIQSTSRSPRNKHKQEEEDEYAFLDEIEEGIKRKKIEKEERRRRVSFSRPRDRRDSYGGSGGDEEAADGYDGYAGYGDDDRDGGDDAYDDLDGDDDYDADDYADDYGEGGAGGASGAGAGGPADPLLLANWNLAAYLPPAAAQYFHYIVGKAYLPPPHTGRACLLKSSTTSFASARLSFKFTER